MRGNLAGMMLAAAAIGWSASAAAQTPDVPGDLPVLAVPPAEPPAKAPAWQWTLGLGAAVLPDYEGSEDYELLPVPLIRVQKGAVYGNLLGNHLTSNLVPDPNWRLGPSARTRRGYGDVDNKRVNALREVNRDFEIGLKGGYDYRFPEGAVPNAVLSLATEVLVDVSGESDGFVVTPSAHYGMLLNERWDARVGTSIDIASDGYTSYYFGVDRKGAQSSGLDTYNADGGVKDVSFNVGVGYKITEAWKLTLLGQYKRLVDDAADSPVVDDEGNPNNVLFGAVVSYAW
jgi:outer membrane protein